MLCQVFFLGPDIKRKKKRITKRMKNCNNENLMDVSSTTLLSALLTHSFANECVNSADNSVVDEPCTVHTQLEKSDLNDEQDDSTNFDDHFEERYVNTENHENFPCDPEYEINLYEETVMNVDVNKNQHDSQYEADVIDDNKPTIANNQLRSYKISIDMYVHRRKALHFYTGLEDYEKFMFVYSTLGPAVNELTYIYGTSPQDITPVNQFFGTLMILRHNKSYYEISLLFDISEKQVANIFITWIRFMSLQWSEISQWPSKDLVNFFTPHDFRRKFLGTRGILDGTEIPILRPGKPNSQQSTFSTYKNKSTVKTVVLASPGGLVSFLSTTYAGSASDRQIIERSNLMSKCEPGDLLMADKGFDIQDMLAPYGIKLNISTFFKKKNQLSEKSMTRDKKISSKRVHIERIIGLGKTYDILKGPMKTFHIKLADDIIFVCFMLCNFRKCIIHPDK